MDIYEMVFTGDALQKLGILQENKILVQAGNLIIYSSLSGADTSIRTIANIYPIIVKSNYFIRTQKFLAGTETLASGHGLAQNRFLHTGTGKHSKYFHRFSVVFNALHYAERNS